MPCTPLSGLGAIATRYDLVLCDVFGVLHDAHEVYREASESRSERNLSARKPL